MYSVMMASSMQGSIKRVIHLFCCTSIAVRRFHQPGDQVNHAPFQSDLNKQFIKQTGAHFVLPVLKKKDIAVMMELLKDHIKPENHLSQDNPYVITDVGGGDGAYMLDPFLEMGMMLMPYVIEPDMELLAKYKNKVENLEKENKVVRGRFFQDTLEKFNFIEWRAPKSHLTLCSHSLYYSRKLWEDVKGSLDQHLFTKLLRTVQAQGVLCIILQSGDTTLVPGGYGIHAELEDLTYPITFRIEGKPGFSHQDHISYTNAERFQQAMNFYVSRLKMETGIEVKISSAVSVSQVSLGRVNFQFDKEGKCPQHDERAQQVLLFYTKKYYNQYSTEELKKFLDFVEDRCKIPTQEYVMTHVNKVFVLSTDRQLPDHLVTKFNQ